MSDLLAQALQLESSLRPQVCLFTDGSGHVDGMGGWCCVATLPDRQQSWSRMGCASGSSVDSMEFTALLEGLAMLEEKMPEWNRGAIRRLGAKPLVLWRSDRESLVRSVTGEYKRSNLPAFWARFAYYENLFQIVPAHVNREMESVLPEFRFCDLHASTMREVLKGYLPTVG